MYAHAEAKCPNCRRQHVGQANPCPKERVARQAAKRQKPPPSPPSSSCPGAVATGGGKSGVAKPCTGWVQQNGRVKASGPV